MANKQVTVTTTPTLLVAADPHDQTVIIRAGSSDVYIGNAGVTISNGFLMEHKSVVTFPLGAYEALYGVCASGTVLTEIYSVVN
jgi:hypothetical protein